MLDDRETIPIDPEIVQIDFNPCGLLAFFKQMLLLNVLRKLSL